MSKVKIEKELIKVRGQLQSLQKKEAYLEQELKMAEAAEKQAILDKHHISVEELTAMIKTKKEEEKKEFEMWHREERVYGYFERAFSVPVETEGDEIRAKFENGVLAVSFPKHEAAKAPAKVAIQID